MKLHDYNVRAFVLTVQEFPERTTQIQDHFKSVGLEAETFNCVSSALSGLGTVFPYEVDNPGSNFNMGPKGVANWISQYMLWSAMLYMPEDHFLQLEWDSQFPADWKARTERALRDVPRDFDVLFIGSCCTNGMPKTLIAGEVYDIRYPMCSHGLIIAKKALPTFIATQRKVYANADISIKFHTLGHLKVYTVLPAICTQQNTVLVP
jgi:hypothetical protein